MSDETAGVVGGEVFIGGSKRETDGVEAIAKAATSVVGSSSSSESSDGYSS